MTKAKKGLIITLFAAMMVFAFGATSVFATGLPEDAVCTWSDNYHKVTITNVAEHNNTTYNAIVTFDSSDGMITATTVGATQEVAWDAPAVSYHFYDLTGAVFCNNNTAIVGTYDNGQSDSTAKYPGANSLKLVEPSYTTGYDAAHPKSAVVAALDGLTNYKGTIKETPAYDATEVEQQQFELTFSGSYKKAYDGTVDYPEILNAVASKTVTVLAKVPEVGDATFYKDSVDKDNKIGKLTNDSYVVKFYYDGSEHSIEMAPLEGFSVAYSVMNATTGKWDPVDAVKITDVLDKGEYIQAKAVVTKDSDAKVTGTQLFNVLVIPAFGATFTWDADDDYPELANHYDVEEGTMYNPADYVVPNANKYTNESEKKYDADKAAVEANKEELMAFFTEKYEFEKSTKKAYPNSEKQTIKLKKLTDDEGKALKEKYATLIANFGKYDLLSAQVDSSAIFHFVPATVVDDEVLFTEAPDMTYHVKKAKKLKKTKSFTVAAVAASGKTVSYKMDSSSKKITIDSATGKITVKKGIKKGTYKVKVIAQTTKGAGYDDAWAVRYLQIKVKK